MERINAVTFAPFCARGTFEKEETRQSLKLMKEKTGANYVIFAPNGVQKTAFSENIDYRTTRDCVMYQKWPETDLWIKMILWGIVSFLIGYYVFSKKENNVMQKI